MKSTYVCFMILLYVEFSRCRSLRKHSLRHALNEANLLKFGETQRQLIEDEYNCKGLRGRNDTETDILIEKCQQMMNSPMMQQSKRMLLNQTAEDLLQAKREYIARRHKPSSGRHKRQLIIGRIGSTCPIFTDAYLARDDVPMREKTISPHKSYTDFSHNRHPQYITQYKCLCQGCIDPRTRREDKRVKSQPIVQPNILVYMRNADGSYREHLQDVNVGCTCIFPL